MAISKIASAGLDNLSTATVTTLKASSGPLATQNGMDGICKAWVNFDGVTGSGNTIYGSYNVSSITKNGTGDYTMNFTTALSNTYYSYAGVATFGQSNSTATGRYVCPYGGSYPFGMATTSLRFLTVYAVNSGTQDCGFINIIVCGT